MQHFEEGFSKMQQNEEGAQQITKMRGFNIMQQIEDGIRFSKIATFSSGFSNLQEFEGWFQQTATN